MLMKLLKIYYTCLLKSKLKCYESFFSAIRIYKIRAKKQFCFYYSNYDKEEIKFELSIKKKIKNLT